MVVANGLRVVRVLRRVRMHARLHVLVMPLAMPVVRRAKVRMPASAVRAPDLVDSDRTHERPAMPAFRVSASRQFASGSVLGACFAVIAQAYTAGGGAVGSGFWAVAVAGFGGGGLKGIVLGATAPPLMMKLIA